MIWLFCDKIEIIDFGFGIEVMMLVVMLVEFMIECQVVSSLIEVFELDLLGLIDMFVNWVGVCVIYCFVLVVSDVFE